jgi:type VI secretion system protein ImpH
MGAEDRPPTRDLTWLERLARDPGGFDFHAALRRFEATFAEGPRLGAAAHPAEEPVRLGQLPSLAFEPSSLFAHQAGDDSGAFPVATIFVSFLGLWGPNGPLPAHLTEYARERLRNAGDRTLSRFADLFHHRMLLLFHRAWAMAQPAAGLDRPGDDRFAKYVGATMGLALPSVRDRDALPDRDKLFYAGRFSAAPRSAEGLADIVGGRFRLPARVEPFIGQWLEIPASARWRLGGSPETSALGRTAVLGRRVWTRTQKFRIVLGPMPPERLRDFLPGRPALSELVALVRLYTNDEWDWDVQLSLLTDQARAGMALGKDARLGLSTRLGRGSGVETDIVLDPHLGRTTRVGRAKPTS